MSHGPKEITSTQLVFDAARDLHAMGEEITREALVAATGLKQYIVDERLRVLVGDERMKRVGRGAFALGEQYHEARAMSKTLLPNGLMKYEIGDVTLLLSPAEDRMLCILVAGSSAHIATIEATRQVGIVQALFAQRLAHVEKMTRDRNRRADARLFDREKVLRKTLD